MPGYSNYQLGIEYHLIAILWYTFSEVMIKKPLLFTFQAGVCFGFSTKHYYESFKISLFHLN
jgi:hypothetical protein